MVNASSTCRRRGGIPGSGTRCRPRGGHRPAPRHAHRPTPTVTLRLRGRSDPRRRTDGAAFFPDHRDEHYRNPNKGTMVFTGDLTLRVGDHDFNLLHTPGHTPDQIAVHVPEERVVFTDDTGHQPAVRTACR